MCRLRNIALESVTEKCDRRTDRRTDDGQSDPCVAMLRRRHKNCAKWLCIAATITDQLHVIYNYSRERESTRLLGLPLASKWILSSHPAWTSRQCTGTTSIYTMNKHKIRLYLVCISMKCPRWVRALILNTDSTEWRLCIQILQILLTPLQHYWIWK